MPSFLIKSSRRTEFNTSTNYVPNFFLRSSPFLLPFLTHPLTSHHTFTLTSFLLAGFHLMPWPLVCLTCLVNTQPLLTALTCLLKHYPSILHLASSACKILESRNLPWYYLHLCVYKQVRLPLKNGGTKLRVLKRGYLKKSVWMVVSGGTGEWHFILHPTTAKMLLLGFYHLFLCCWWIWIHCVSGFQIDQLAKAWAIQYNCMFTVCP